MANSDELTFDLAVEQLDRLKADAGQIVSDLQKAASIKFDNLSKTGTISSASELKEQNKAKQEAIGLDGQLTEWKKKQIAYSQTLNALQKTERDNIKANSSAYSQISKMYGDALQKAKDLSVQYGAGSKEAEAWSKRANQLNNEIKKVDFSLGNHQRNVGNYTKSIRPLTEVLEGLGRALGLPIDGLREYSGALRGAMHLHEETKVAGEEQIAVNEAESASWLAALGPIAWVVAGLAALTAGIILYIGYSKHAQEMQDIQNTSFDGTIHKTKELADEWDELKMSLDSITNKWNVLNGTMSEYEATIADIEEKGQKKLNDELKKTAKAVDEAGGFWATFLHTLYLGTAAGAAWSASEKAAALQAGVNNELLIQQSINTEKLIAAKKEEEKAQTALNEAMSAARKFDELQLQDAEKLALLRNKAAGDTLQAKIKEVQIKLFYDKKIEENSEDIQGIKNEKIKTMEEESAIEISQIRDEFRKKEEAQREEDLKKYEAWLKAQLSLYEKALQDKKKIFEEQTKTEGSLIDAIAKNASSQTTEEAALSGNKVGVENERYYQKTLATRKYYQNLIQQANGNAALIATLNQQWNKQMELDSKEHENKLTEIKKQGLKDRSKAGAKSIKDSLEALKKELDSQNKIRQQSLKEQMDNLHQQVEQDKNLNAQGRKNGLAQSMAQENRIAVQQMSLETQTQGINAALNLANLLLSLSTGKGYYEGTTDTGGPGLLDNKGGMLAMLHPHEAVIPRARNEEYPGLAKAWISGNLDTYLAKLAMPEIQGASMKKIETELSEIKDVLIKKPWAVAYNHGNKAIIEEHTGDGKKTRIIEEPTVIRVM